MKPLPTPVGSLSLFLLLALPASTSACGEGQTSILPLPTLGGALTRVLGLSPGGQLTGYSQTSNNLTHAFLYTGATMLDLTLPGTDYGQGVSVNSAGQVAGDTATGVFETHAFVYDGAILTDLGTLGGSFSTAVAINEAGQVTGNSLLPDGFSFVAFQYSGGALSALGTLGGASSFANGMNQAGQIVGVSTVDLDFESHAFYFTNGVMLDLGTLGGSYSAAFAVNGDGVVVGESDLANYETHAFGYTGGVMTDLGTLGGSYSSAFAVNASGQIVGVSTTAGDLADHGFSFSAGVLSDLGTLGGDYCEPLALDNLGRVVGVAELADGTVHGFLWQNGTMQDLNDLLPTNSGWQVLSAEFINDAGRIVGYGLLNGVERVYILDLGSGNNPPVAVAGADQVVDCQTPAQLDGSASVDPDGDSLGYEWSENGTILGTNAALAVSLSPGVHFIVLKVSDACGLRAEDGVSVTVTDTTAPTLTCPPDLTVAAGADCLAMAPDLALLVSVADNCTPADQLVLSQSPAPGTSLAVGVHSATVTVVDASGNTVSTNLSLLVVDQTPPSITSLTASPDVLSPPNGKAVSVTVSVVATDPCDSALVSSIVSVTCNEASDAGDIQVTGPLTVALAAVKGTAGSTRVYTITVQCADVAGNTATGIVTVTVPKNGGGGGKKP